MTKKEKYRELCKYEKSIPIFSKDRWMDAVCWENDWDILSVEKMAKLYLHYLCPEKEINQNKFLKKYWALYYNHRFYRIF